MHKRLKLNPKRTILWLILCLSLLLIYLAACSSPPAELVEVTRVVTETVVVEGEAVEVEVTRIVTETVIETVEVEAESNETDELGEDQPDRLEATGSEDDSGPFPPEPEDGPKVTTRGGTTDTDVIATVVVSSETAVPRRANPTQESQSDEPTLITVANTESSNEWQKLCERIGKMHKKQCN